MQAVDCDLISPRQLAAATGWPERRIRALIASKKISHLKHGRKILLPRNAIAEFVSSSMVRPDPQSNEWTDDAHPNLDSVDREGAGRR